MTGRPCLIDAHAHLDMYGDGIDGAIAQIEGQRILTISVSMDVPSFQAARRVAGRCPLVIPAFGIHPWTAPQHVDHMEELGPLIAHSPMIGEIGLDHHFVTDVSSHRAQREVFDFFLAAAREKDIVVNLHTKGAEPEVLEMLVRHDIGRAIVHWYSGPIGLMKGFFDRGYLFTVGVETLVSDGIRRIAARIPTDLLLTETDNPGAYEWYTKSWGKPSLITDVIEKLAEIRKIDRERIEETVRDNFGRLARGDDRLEPWAVLL